MEPIAVKAVDLCRKVCEVNDPIFPGLFQISYEWIYDSGASRRFCKSDKVSGYMHLAKKIKGVMVNTVDGKVEANKLLGMRIERLGNLVTDLMLLPDAPALLSSGALERSGFTSIWAHGYMPCLFK